MRARHLGLALLLLSTADPTEAQALPPITDLIGCPLVDGNDTAQAPTDWTTTALEGTPLTATIPPGWTIERDGRSITVEAPDGQSWLTLRTGRPGDEAYLDRVRRDVELMELGPTHLTHACETRSRAWLRDVSGWSTLRLSVTRRALGMPRRSFALFAPLDGGTLTAIVTVKWRKDGAAALLLARRLLSGLRAR